GSRNRVSSGERVHSLKYRRVRLLNHEQRNVLERLAVVETVTGTQDMLAATGEIVSEAYTRAEIRVVVVRNSSQRAADGLQLVVGGAGTLRSASDKIVVFIPAHAEIERQPVVYLPIVLEIQPEHFGSDDECRVARRGRHAAHEGRIRKTSTRENYVRLLIEI